MASVKLNFQSNIQESNKAVKGEERRGLEFMSVRYNIIEVRRKLRNERKITPSENMLLEEIQIGTLFAQNRKSTILKKADLSIATLAERCGYKSTDKIYALLKSLKLKNLIIREESEYKGHEILGLNEEVFGQLLIDSQEEIHNKRNHRNHLQVISTPQNELTKAESHTFDSEDPSLRTVSSALTDHKQNGLQPIEIIEEKTPLDSFRSFLDSSKGGIFKNFRGNGIKFNQKEDMTPDQIQQRIKFLKSQAEMLDSAVK